MFSTSALVTRGWESDDIRGKATGSGQSLTKTIVAKRRIQSQDVYKRQQVELAFTDAISLGIDDIPIRLSGNIDGTPGAFIMGPAGMVELKEGVIRAAIHVHMNPGEAAYYGVKHGEMMKLRVGGDAGVTFNRVHVRVDPKVRLNVHMDTDEANACGLHLAREIELVK